MAKTNAMKKLIYFFIFISVIGVKGQGYVFPDPNYTIGAWSWFENLAHIFIPDGSALIPNSTLSPGAVRKKLPNGNYDPTFGVNGSIPVYIPEPTQMNCVANGQHIYTYDPLPNTNNTTFIIKKYNSNGVLDLTYGNNGELTINMNYRLFIDQNSNVYFYGNNGFRKILPNGEFDNNFNLIPQAFGDLKFSNNYIYIGKYRYNYNGSQDIGFENAALKYTLNKMTDESISFSKNESSSTLTINKYTSSGALDTNFGTNGTKIITQFTYAPFYSADFDSEGNIVFFGGNNLNSSGGMYPSITLIMRLKPNGAEDYSFNNNSFYYIGQNTGYVLDGKVISDDKYLLFVKKRYTMGSNHVNISQVVRSLVLSTSDIENSEKKLSVYPNPVQDVLKVLLNKDEKLQTIEIFDVTGKLIKKSTVLENNVADFTTGSYLIMIKTDKKTYQTKFIKN
ncbi:T9SS type A sorting domain-containing protein [Chryseobacterium sp.]|uniref:T9SS type A sorting domain-containing protein n=1 Tax=Chryseobacterium sp. TaxID=1871047 RepID=UPI0032196B62